MSTAMLASVVPDDAVYDRKIWPPVTELVAPTYELHEVLPEPVFKQALAYVCELRFDVCG
jgi:hypothetical protein